eukprot:554250-Pyramimonas_sp.AAC.3
MLNLLVALKRRLLASLARVWGAAASLAQVTGPATSAGVDSGFTARGGGFTTGSSGLSPG